MLSMMMTVETMFLTDEDKKNLKKYNPVGVTLFGRNIDNKIQLKNLIDDIKETVEREDILIATDQEGGRVRRLAEPNWNGYAPQSALNIESVKYHGMLIAKDLFEMGINVNYAPVLDIAYENTSAAVKSRCFSDNEKDVTNLGKILLDTYIKNGICPCIKHMPGTGRAVQDAHLELPVINYKIKELAKDFYPFKQLKYSPMGMTAHILIPEIDENLPITQSTKGISKIIRGEIGFEGLLLSDALDMKALKGSMGEKAKASLNVGCDVVCFYSANQKDIDDIAANCKKMSDKSLERMHKVYETIKNKLIEKEWEETAQKYYKIVGDISKYKEDYDATEVLKKIQLS